MTWHFWIDVGGTFADCLGRGPDGRLLRHKLLSSGVTKGAVGPGSERGLIVDPARRVDPEAFWAGCSLRLLGASGQTIGESTVADFEKQTGTLRLDAPLPVDPTHGQPYELAGDEEAPIIGIRYMLGLPRAAELPPMAVRLGTTRGTNALITRRGAATALVTTKGFGDVLQIGYQNRPRLFDLNVRKREPLFGAVVEIDERITPEGEVLIAPDAEAVRRELTALRQQGIESLAVCLLHAYADGRHEELVGRIAREVGFEEVSLSSRVAPLVKIVSRGDTTVMDAYLNPVLRAYVDRLRASIGAGRLQILTSAGGLVDADRFVGKDSILSGPAGGVVGFSRVAGAAGFDRAIGFDMGGTSTDVSRYDGRYELEYETEKAGVRVVAPMMAIETVAAGGGSICRFDGVKLVVGPDSAGADPGPACYGRGGPLAVTDLNFYQGKILPAHFPFPLNRDAAGARLAAMCDEVFEATGTRYSLHELADGLLKVAANHQGAGDLVRVIDHYGLPVVEAYMGHIQAAAERKMRAALARLPDGRRALADATDDGSPIAVGVTIRGDEATIDFTGTGPVVPGNLNANRAIVTAAVMYCLRCLIDEDIPLNQGVLAPIRLVLPECLLNPPRRPTPEQCAAVVGGNVETSQRVVDCLLGALGVAAASQGTMNNVMFGDRTFGYYETICGGAGATPDGPGADAVHTHMTNTRLTDPEVLEQRYPVRVQEFSIRRGSGGAGAHRGGDGAVRRIEFLRPLDLSILSQRRGPHPPFGLAGGEPGALGRNTLHRADGSIERLAAQVQCTVHSGDVLLIETPGGGGFGPQ